LHSFFTIRIYNNITIERGTTMLALKIQGQGIRGFMHKLLNEPVFDRFEVRGVTIISFTRFEISCALESRAEEEAVDGTERRFCDWARLRPCVKQLIVGEKTPRLMKVIFALSSERAAAVHENAAALFLNVTYENGEVLFTTASSEKSFSLDKGIDAAWEEMVQRFMNKHGIQTADAMEYEE